LREQALRVRGKIIEIEFNQRRACADLIAGLYAWMKALAFQRHCIDADMQENLRAFCCAERYGMTGGVQRSDIAIARRHEHGVDWIDRRTIADHLLGENRIGDALEWPDDAGERRAEGEQLFTHGRGSSFFLAEEIGYDKVHLELLLARIKIALGLEPEAERD
jgi:hypothetical protein